MFLRCRSICVISFASCVCLDIDVLDNDALVHDV
jgi:hypothetical protein